MSGRLRRTLGRPWVAAGAGALAALVVSGLWSGLRGVPPSTLASPAAEAARRAERGRMLPALPTLLFGDIAARRAALDARFYGPRIDEARRLYPVRQRPDRLDGVYVERFDPVAGVAPENRGRVLINLHGGAFSLGARTEGRLESIPVAATMQVPVISIDYRQGPENRFPAASEDVARVYRTLLRRYRPDRIGIFGCSAGGLLAAQSVAWFQAHGLPRPGALGIFCAGAGRSFAGDARIAARALGAPRLEGEVAYLKGTDTRDPMVSPLNADRVLARFPPTLVISATRDPWLSAALATHRRLLAVGVPAELHVFEGVGHFFFADTALPESRDAFRTITEFFNRRLAR